MAFVAIDQLINLHDGYRKHCIIAKQELLLIQEEGQRFLIQASCPHLHWPLLGASVSNSTIHCGKHGFAFSLISGQPANSRASGCAKLQCYSISYEGSAIGVELNH